MLDSKAKSFIMPAASGNAGHLACRLSKEQESVARGTVEMRVERKVKAIQVGGM